jgi:hypothetical protein
MTNLKALSQLVMPGLVPGIHVLTVLKQERRGWPGRSPAMTEWEMAGTERGHDEVGQLDGRDGARP